VIDLLLLDIILCILLNLHDIIACEFVLFKLLFGYLLLLRVLIQVHLFAHSHIILLLVMILVLLVAILLVGVLVVSGVVFVLFFLHLQSPLLNPIIIPSVCLAHKLVSQVQHDSVAPLLDDLSPYLFERVAFQLESLQSLVGAKQERDGVYVVVSQVQEIDVCEVVSKCNWYLSDLVVA
jgi:hypothetical protein